MHRVLRDTMNACWGRFARHAETLYVAGHELEDALALGRRIGQKGWGVVLCRWNGENDSGRRVADGYLEAIDGLTSAGLDGHVSVKAPALDFSHALVTEVASAAGEAGRRMHFDAQRCEVADATFELTRLAARFAKDVGCTLPGRWERSVDDVALASDFSLSVRVVKGESPDASGADAEPRAGYLRVIDALAASSVRQVGVATHDPPLARAALERLLDRGKQCELELLLGLPMTGCLAIAEELNVQVRIYLPYGVPSMRYHYSDLRRDPRVFGWFLQDLLAKGPRTPLATR